ncbi:MAG: amidase [Microscillaceae bacterium]|jgi:Asp-tRNA(Asn)/Glu-tRNA(Gln) amidotransferase A subunit family amidase|nr:amidase [Microscillaceae bacterium]
MKNSLPFKKIGQISLFGLICFVCGAFLPLYLSDQITLEVVKSAEKIIGLEFTQAEADSMLEELNDQRRQYAEIRQTDIPNALAPSLVFNPLPVGFTLDKTQKPFSLGKIEKVKLPTSRDDLAFYSVQQLAELLRTKQITAVELTQFFLARLKKYDSKLYCVISLTEERALAQAQKADAEIKQGKYRGLLHGIPYGAKDLLAVKGYKTTWGAEPYQNQEFEYDASVIRQLDEAGAILVAKLTLGALAWGDVWFGGMTRNPWNLAQGSSGSSAGSASAVAAGLVPFAIGSETWGSIVSPATVCGTTGLRPTFGRVSKHGAMALSWSMDKLGPITRTAEDCAIILNTINGADGLDLSVIDAPFNYDAKKNYKTLKVGYLKKLFQAQYGFKENDSLSLQKFKDLGIELVPVEFPEFPDISFLLSAEAAAAFDALTRTNRDDMLKRQMKRAWPNTFRAARFIPAVEYINAQRIRSQIIAQMAEKMKNLDVVIAPSWYGNTLLLTNLTGHPCLVMPNGFNKNGTPTSISLIGKLFGEADLITLGKAFQDNSAFHRQKPKLD